MESAIEQQLQIKPYWTKEPVTVYRFVSQNTLTKLELHQKTHLAYQLEGGDQVLSLDNLPKILD